MNQGRGHGTPCPEGVVDQGKYTYTTNPVSVTKTKSKKKSLTNKKHATKKQKITIGTLNVSTLQRTKNFTELEKAFKKSNLAVPGLSEVRRGGEWIQTTKKGNLFHYIGSKGGQKE